MTEGSPLRSILAVALPLMEGNVFQQLYTVVDAQIVGRVEGLGVLITCVSLLSIRPVLNLLQTPAEVRGMSARYLSVVFGAFLIVMDYDLTAGILRALGDGRSPLYAMMIAAGVNIALDLLFVAGLGWGVAGAAAASTCCRAWVTKLLVA